MQSQVVPLSAGVSGFSSKCAAISHYLNEQGTGNEFIIINAITKLIETMLKLVSVQSLM